MPVDRTAESAAGLAPVFALLADVEHEAVIIRERGAEAARQRVETARNLAASIVADAEDRAAAVRAAAAAETLNDAERTAAGLAARGQERATRIRELATARTPALADRALTLLTDAVTSRSRDGVR